LDACAGDLTVAIVIDASAVNVNVPGSYPVHYTVSDCVNSVTVDRTVTVNKAVLTVTANNASRPYGVANPAFTASYSGFQNGETLATSGVTGSPSLTTVATPTSAVGNYDHGSAGRWLRPITRSCLRTTVDDRPGHVGHYG
jgi:hypothetical protein